MSPHHAMFLDGVLVPAECLVNGTSIMRERTLASVEYFHVELATHDVILAEGAPTESFVDDNGVGQFENAGEHAELYPSAPAMAMSRAAYCAEPVGEGYRLEAIRRRLAALEGEFALIA